MALNKKKIETQKLIEEEDDIYDKFMNFQTSADKDEKEEALDDSLDPPKNSSIKREENKPKKSNNLVIKICLCGVAGAVVVLFLYMAFFRNSTSDKKEPAKETNVQQTQTQDEEVRAGAPNLTTDTKTSNTASVVESTTLTKDLNKQSIDVNYNVQNIKTVRDYINYEKFRSITDAGLEIYWLEATYKDRKYIVQVPYKIFKELDTKGITVVDVEVVTTDTQSEVVTYMNVVENSKSLINQNKG